MTEDQATSLTESLILKAIRAVPIPQAATGPIARYILEIAFAIKQERRSEANRTPEARRERRELLRKMSKNFGQLVTLISKIRPDIRNSVDDLLAAPAGEYLSVQAFADIGVPIDTEVSDRVLTSREVATSRGGGGPYVAIEREVAVARRLAARRSAGRAIASFLGRIKQHIDLRLQLMKTKGGRPPNVYRRFTIEALADIYEQQVKTPPTTSVTGPFMKLCEQSLLLLEIELDGLERAVERELNKRHKKN